MGFFHRYGRRLGIMNILFLAGLNFLNSEMGVADIPLIKIVAVIVVITLVQIFRKLFASIIIKYFEDLTSQTESELDDELIAIIKQPLNLLIVIAGIGLAKLIIVSELNPAINEILDNLIGLIAIALCAWIIFRASPLLGELLGKKYWYKKHDSLYHQSKCPD